MTDAKIRHLLDRLDDAPPAHHAAYLEERAARLARGVPIWHSLGPFGLTLPLPIPPEQHNRLIAAVRAEHAE